MEQTNNKSRGCIPFRRIRSNGECSRGGKSRQVHSCITCEERGHTKVTCPWVSGVECADKVIKPGRYVVGYHSYKLSKQLYTILPISPLCQYNNYELIQRLSTLDDAVDEIVGDDFAVAFPHSSNNNCFGGQLNIPEVVPVKKSPSLHVNESLADKPSQPILFDENAVDYNNSMLFTQNMDSPTLLCFGLDPDAYRQAKAEYEMDEAIRQNEEYLRSINKHRQVFGTTDDSSEDTIN